jgi:hypothetical protein
MSDFERLSEPGKTLLQIKLDGHVEACVHAASSLNIGSEEALCLTATALMREFSARGFDRSATKAVVAAALDKTFPTQVLEANRHLS